MYLLFRSRLHFHWSLIQWRQKIIHSLFTKLSKTHPGEDGRREGAGELRMGGSGKERMSVIEQTQRWAAALHLKHCLRAAHLPFRSNLCHLFVILRLHADSLSLSGTCNSHHSDHKSWGQPGSPHRNIAARCYYFPSHATPLSPVLSPACHWKVSVLRINEIYDLQRDCL